VIHIQIFIKIRKIFNKNYFSVIFVVFLVLFYQVKIFFLSCFFSGNSCSDGLSWITTSIFDTPGAVQRVGSYSSIADDDDSTLVHFVQHSGNFP
jgi:hypothetical protein